MTKISRWGEGILDEFSKAGNDVDITHLINLMESMVFNIVLTNHQRDHIKDQQLLASLKSPVDEEKSLAILTVIYNVRCNYVHGDKEYHHYQTLLLEPVYNLLQTLTSLLYSKLK